jgi:acyl dehydratase
VEFPTLTKRITIEKMARYSGAGNIHSDDQTARERGLGGAIVQGGQLVGYLDEMLVRALGEGFVRGGEISVTFIQAARPGDTLTTHGTVTSARVVDGRERVECEVWLENSRGEKVTVGTASGFAPASR